MGKIVSLDEYKLGRTTEEEPQTCIGAEAVEALKYITNNTIIQIRHTTESEREKCEWVPAVYLGRMNSTAEDIKDEDAYFFLLPGMAVIEVLQTNMKSGNMWIRVGATIDREDFEELMNNLMEWTLQVNACWA